MEQTNTTLTESAAVAFTAPAAEPAPSRPRGLQDTQHAQALTRALEIITALAENDELRAVLSARGVDDAFIAQGAALQLTAQQTYAARQLAMASAQSASLRYGAASEQVRSTFNEFRMTARMLFPDPSVWTALGLPGKYPRSLEQVVSNARVSYAAALSDGTHDEALAQLGYTSAKLTSMTDELDALVALRAERDNTRSAAVNATRARDDALEALDVWLRRLRLTVRLAARERPEFIALVS